MACQRNRRAAQQRWHTSTTTRMLRWTRAATLLRVARTSAARTLIASSSTTALCDVGARFAAGRPLSAANECLMVHVRRYSVQAAAVDEVVNVPVPAMGDMIVDATVVEWYKHPGDFVQADDVVLVMETDKVSVDVRAPFAGQLVEQLVNTDDKVPVGSDLFQMCRGSADAAVPAAMERVQGPVMDVRVPSLGDNIADAVVVQWLKQPGDHVTEGDSVVILETDKVSLEVSAPCTGQVTHHWHGIGSTVSVGAPLFQFSPI